MLEGLLQMGNALIKEENMISNFIQDIEPIRSNKQLNVLKINFDLINDKLIIDVNEEMDKNTAKKYNFIGSTGSRSAQWYTSSSSVAYHLSETIANLAKIDLGDILNTKIKEVMDVFYYDLDKGLGMKYSKLLDLNKLGISNKTIDEIYKESISNPKVGKKTLEGVIKEFDSYLKDNYDQNLKGFGLFIIQINGEIISQNQDYIEKVIESKKPKEKKKTVLSKGICSACQTTENLTADLTKTKIKTYTTNQAIFASQFDKSNYHKNMQLCEGCLMKLLAGENYTINNLDTRLSGFNVYIIPQFIYGEPLDEKELKLISDKIIKSFNTVKSFDSIRELKDEISMSLDFRDMDSLFLLNFLFYRSSQASTKVQALVKDVNPSIFEKISNALISSNEGMKVLMGANWRNQITLNTAYYMHPIKLFNGSPVQYRDVLQTYDHILTEKRLNKKHVIENIVECMKIIRLEKPSYNIDTKSFLEFYILQSNMYIQFLRHMNCIKEGQNLKMDNLALKEEIKSYITDMKYDEEQTAMFLLGSLIGEIGIAQYDRDSEDKNKPILNKINWNGVDMNKVIRLTKDVFNKLNQEKIRQYNEITFSEMKRLLDKNIANWAMNKDENLFYILSGYSYITARQMLKGAKVNEK